MIGQGKAGEIAVLDVLDAVGNLGRLTRERVLGLDECNDTVS